MVGIDASHFHPRRQAQGFGDTGGPGTSDIVLGNDVRWRRGSFRTCSGSFETEVTLTFPNSSRLNCVRRSAWSPHTTLIQHSWNDPINISRKQTNLSRRGHRAVPRGKVEGWAGRQEDTSSGSNSVKATAALPRILERPTFLWVEGLVAWREESTISRADFMASLQACADVSPGFPTSANPTQGPRGDRVNLAHACIDLHVSYLDDWRALKRNPIANVLPHAVGNGQNVTKLPNPRRTEAHPITPNLLER